MEKPVVALQHYEKSPDSLTDEKIEVGQHLERREHRSHSLGSNGYLGCPPSLEDVQKGLEKCGVDADLDVYKRFRDSLVERYKGKEGFDESLFYIR